MALEVKVWLKNPDVEELADGDAAFNGEVDFVSMFNDSTYGAPALVAPEKSESPKARPGDVVLYVNTASTAAMTIERLAD